ncbi:hypothetical protein PINS_up014437 [Pythium insidiosum]|nr:hypothetical protein PINS_up014437 [Pythium insidiosum]
MKLYTGEEDLYESFSSDSSSGSTCVNAVFGCQEADDIQKWEWLYSVFDNPAPLDEMQLLFFSKALVRLHDGFCLEEGYVSNVLHRFLPSVLPHLYSNTVKYMLTLILQSYESVHPITGRNDAMEILVPLLPGVTKIETTQQLSPPAVENAAHLLVDMLQANQADRLGAFCRREGGVYLSKYFVRDQFGTIRGFESMTHGYHNFLQFMFLDELGKVPDVISHLFENALTELEAIQTKQIDDISGWLNVHVATEMLLLYRKHGSEVVSSTSSSSGSDEDNEKADVSPVNQSTSPFAHPSTGAYHAPSGPSDSYPTSPRPSVTEAAMYSLATLTKGTVLWSTIFQSAKSTATRFCRVLDSGLPSSVEIALAKYLHALVNLNDAEIDHKLHEGGLMQRYLDTLSRRPSFDMLHIHTVPAIAFVLKDSDGSRGRDNPLTSDLFDATPSLPDLLLRAEEDCPALKIYTDLLKEVIDDVLAIQSPSENNSTLRRLCKHIPPWGVSSPTSAMTPRSAASSVSEDRASVKRDSQRSLRQSDVEETRSSGHSSHGEADEAPATGVGIGRRLSTPKIFRSTSTRSDKSPPADDPSSNQSEHAEEPRADDGGKKSGHYIKQMLQAPVFRGSVRLGSVIKTPEKPHASEHAEDTQTNQRNSFGWNSMLKRLRKSFVTSTQSDKGEKKILALTNEPYVPPPIQTSQAEALVIDTSKGEDVTKFVFRDGGVHVTDVPSRGNNDSSNVVTCGYMYKNKFPETGQRHVWERYYFVLDRQEGSLSYYVSETHAKDRTFLRGAARPISVTEGIPVSASGQRQVHGFQINTQGHGAFMVVVDSIDTRLVWLTEIVATVAVANPQPLPKRLSLVSDDGSAARAAAAAAAAASGNSARVWSKQELKDLVVDYYRNLFGPSLRFSTPMDAPASFWMEEKIDPIADSCVLSSNLPDCVPFWGEFHGYKRMCDFWKTRDETIERSSGRVLRIVVDEDEETAVVMTSTTYRILRNSQVVTEESCDILNMSGGSIISIHCTFDSFRIAESFKKEGVSAS